MPSIPSQEATAPEQAIVGANDYSPVPQSPAAAQARDATRLFDLSPALFVENQGQWSDPSIRYVHDGNRVDVAVTGRGIVFQVARTQPAPEDGGQRAEDRGQNAVPSPTLQPAGTSVLRFGASFVGAHQVLPMGLERSPSEFHYFVGGPSLWRPKVRAYERVVYEGLYDGVDLHVRGLGSHLKYEFHVAPGADWSQISIRYDGIGGLSLAGDGALVLDLGGDWGTMVDDRPYIYQVIDGRRVDIAGSFRLLDSRTYAFGLTGSYDPAYELVIDPNVVWSTYLGGSAGDWGYGVALDSGGNVYVTGQTQSSDWSIGDSGTTFQGSSDAFVAKVSPAGTCLWRTYLGGAGDDRGYSVALDSDGNVYVTGQTESADWTSNGFDTSYNGATDAFVAKLGSAGEVLWSSYLGGTGGDWGYGLAVDASDNIYVTGQTESPEDWTLGGFDMTYNGASDAFVAQLSPAGACLWSTYVGGPDRDWAYAIAVDSTGNVYVTGPTLSAVWVSAGYDPTHDGVPDAFVAKLSSAGDSSLWSTCLGGSSDDYGRDIAVDASDNVYVTGETQSSAWPNQVPDTTYQGDSDVFVAKLSSAGVSLWSTYLGGAAGDWGYGVAADSSGNVYVTGTTESSGWTNGGFDTTYDGASDAFVVKLSPAGASLWSSYLGGSGEESGYGIAVDSSGYIYATGQTQSSDWARGGFDTAYGGSGDAFLVKIAFGALVPVYRFWSAATDRHFYTIRETEKDKLINNYSHIWTYEGAAYRAFADSSQPGVAPIYRFWSDTANAHFYTIKEAEKDKLISKYSHLWTFEGVAFYAYADGFQPAGAYAVYRFWSDTLGFHFYTMRETERDKLISRYSFLWAYEGPAWYAYPVVT